MKKYIVILLAFFLPFVAFGQSDLVKFKEKTFDFGTIKEEKGVVTHTFAFKNLGKVPVIIKSVQASCGCTTPIWTKKPVLPQKTGVIKVTYNPMNRPNKFIKTITVTTNLGRQQLTIKGVVTPRPKSLAEQYPKKMEELRLKTSYVIFNEIGNKQEKIINVEVVNDSKKPIKVGFGKMPAYVKITMENAVLQPKQKGLIKVAYNAEKTKFWGFHSDLIQVLVNGKQKVASNLVVTATVIEDFSKMSKEELAKAPRVGVDKLEEKLKSVVAGDKVKIQFKITNIGQSPLVIHNIDQSSKSLAVKISKRKIAPNTQAVVDVVFDTKGKKGYQNEQITLITNAPDLPIIDFKISGFLE